MSGNSLVNWGEVCKLRRGRSYTFLVSLVVVEQFTFLLLFGDQMIMALLVSCRDYVHTCMHICNCFQWKTRKDIIPLRQFFFQPFIIYGHSESVFEYFRIQFGLEVPPCNLRQSHLYFLSNRRHEIWREEAGVRTAKVGHNDWQKEIGQQRQKNVSKCFSFFSFAI
jgi:hypothetical protein